MINYFSVPPTEWTNQATFILGGGPSLAGFDVERLRGRGKVIAVNNAYVLAPWADVLFWADTRWLEWNHRDIHRHVGKYKITRKPPHVAVPDDVKTMRFHNPSLLSTKPDTLGGWCGGSSAINLAFLFGSRVVVLLGFDMRPGNWHDYHLLPPDSNQHRKKFIPTLEKMAPLLLQHGVTVINVNERSALRCFPFADIEEILAMDDVAKIEREKYLRVWERPEYRKISPGMDETLRAALVMAPLYGRSLIDFGAGPARATAWFHRTYGMTVTAIDFAPNARETNVPFIEACLWDLPDDLQSADFGYCCDVMEHIPPERVAATLASIAVHVKIGCYFRIATRPDKMGPKLIGPGVHLHVSVNSGEWWRREVEKHFELVDVVQMDARDVVLWARH